jgi:hypothetical protein
MQRMKDEVRYLYISFSNPIHGNHVSQLGKYMLELNYN